VSGAFTKVLGRHSGAVANGFIEKLEAARTDDEATPTGDLMTELRRELMAEGYPIVLAWTVFGDAAWTI
jgi:hypothetical protein